MPRDDDVTGLLVAWGQGDRAADSRLIEVLYQDLRRVARRRLSAERADHSLAPTALVHEAYMRLIDLRRVRWQNRAHFFAIAARIMRQILVDHARAHGAVKRGGARWTVPLTAQAGATTPREVHLLDLDAALDKLAAIDGRLADLVMLRFFGGLTVEEAAEVLSYRQPRSSAIGRAPGHGCSASFDPWRARPISKSRIVTSRRPDLPCTRACQRLPHHRVKPDRHDR